MFTGKGHGRVAAEQNYVLVFLLVLREFGLEVLELLPTTLKFFLSIGSTVQKLETDLFILYHYLKISNLKKQIKKTLKPTNKNPHQNHSF